jgi:hypothetical protein
MPYCVKKTDDEEPQGYNKYQQLKTKYIRSKKKVKIPLLQALEAPRVARGRGSHIT